MKKIINYLKENWIRHGFETLVVTIGILIAFALNNWNEKINDNELRKFYIESLISDLTQDTVILNDAIRYAEADNRKMRGISIKLSTPPGANLDTLKKIAFSEVIWGYQAYRPPSQNTFFIMQSTGKLDLMEKEINDAILDLHIEQKRAESITAVGLEDYRKTMDRLYQIATPNNAAITGPLVEEYYKKVDVHELFLRFNQFLSAKIITNTHLNVARNRVLKKTDNLLIRLKTSKEKG